MNTIPIITRRDHEIQINHLDEAITMFVNGDIDYIVGTGVRNDTRVIFFHITRSRTDATAYTTSERRPYFHRGPGGSVEYADVKRTLLGFIDAFETAYGYRSHERPEQMFIYLGGVIDQSHWLKGIFGVHLNGRPFSRNN